MTGMARPRATMPPAAAEPARAQTQTRTQTLRIAATNDGVRDGLARLIAGFDPHIVHEEAQIAIELAMAEVLNNVVEHAYAGRSDGEVYVIVDVEPSELHFTVVDEGVTMPAGRLPSGSAADPTLAAFEQEEGGYGLFMIRQLARKLRYRRFGDQNQLSFRVPLHKALLPE